MRKNNLFIGSLLGASGVVLGAFGAHTLKKILSAENLALVQTGITYQMYHAIFICIVAALADKLPIKAQQACRLSIIGVLLFSGSLYFLALLKHFNLSTTLIGPITPIGGVFLIAGWLTLAFHTVKKH
jgi:uncharacterized membrane protein YgdD (TMEM256/DUF423 family)